MGKRRTRLGIGEGSESNHWGTAKSNVEEFVKKEAPSRPPRGEEREELKVKKPHPQPLSKGRGE